MVKKDQVSYLISSLEHYLPSIIDTESTDDRNMFNFLSFLNSFFFHPSFFPKNYYT